MKKMLFTLLIYFGYSKAGQLDIPKERDAQIEALSCLYYENRRLQDTADKLVSGYIAKDYIKRSLQLGQEYTTFCKNSSSSVHSILSLQYFFGISSNLSSCPFFEVKGILSIVPLICFIRVIEHKLPQEIINIIYDTWQERAKKVTLLANMSSLKFSGRLLRQEKNYPIHTLAVRNNCLVTAQQGDSGFTLWDLKELKLIRYTYERKIKSVSIAQNEIGILGHDTNMGWYNLTTGEHITSRVYNSKPKTSISSVLLPSGELYIGMENQLIKVIDSDNNQQRMDLDNHDFCAKPLTEKKFTVTQEGHIIFGSPAKNGVKVIFFPNKKSYTEIPIKKWYCNTFQEVGGHIVRDTKLGYIIKINYDIQINNKKKISVIMPYEEQINVYDKRTSISLIKNWQRYTVMVAENNKNEMRLHDESYYYRINRPITTDCGITAIGSDGNTLVLGNEDGSSTVWEIPINADSCWKDKKALLDLVIAE